MEPFFCWVYSLELQVQGSHRMECPPHPSNQRKKKSAVCFSCQLVSVQSVFFLTASVNLPTSNVVRHTVVSAKGMQWTKKTKDYSWIAQLVYLSIAIHVSLRVCLAWQSQTNSKNFKHASAVGSCTTATWIASPIEAAESVFIHLPKIYTELATLAIKEVRTTHAGTIPLLLVLCWALQTLAHLDLGLTALSAGALLSSIWLFDQLCLLLLLFTCSLRIFMASSQVCRFRTSFAGAGLANFEHVPRSQRLCTCNSTLAIDEVAPCRSLIGVRKCCWKHKQQKRRVKRSLVHHGKSAHSWVQEPTLGSWAKTCLGLTYFQRQSAFFSLYTEHVLHRLSFTQTTLFTSGFYRNSMPIAFADNTTRITHLRFEALQVVKKQRSSCHKDLFVRRSSKIKIGAAIRILLAIKMALPLVPT